MATVVGDPPYKKKFQNDLKKGMRIGENPDYPLVRSIKCERSRNYNETGDFIIKVWPYEPTGQWHVSTIHRGIIIFVKNQWFNPGECLEIIEVNKKGPGGNYFARANIVK